MGLVEREANSTWVAEHSLVEWVKNDPRSVAAMLRGRGDGRVEKYLRYEKKMRRANPHMSEEELIAHYSIRHTERDGLENHRHFSKFLLKTERCPRMLESSESIKRTPGRPGMATYALPLLLLMVILM